MEQSCGQCKWFGDGMEQSERNICKWPMPDWLHVRVTSGATERLADYVYESSGRHCRTFERREEP